MKLNFRKISALASSALMLGMTAGIAAAANYPAPFVSGGGADVAIVYGSGAAFSDQTAASNIAESLSGFVSGGGSSVSGESYKFEKTSTKYHLGDNITQVISSSLNDDELPNLLAEGVYTDDDNDEFDYTQAITLGNNLQLSMFEDNDYAADEPTVGYRVPSGTEIISNYTLTFTDQPVVTDMTTTDIPFMGKSYYVLSITSSSGVTTMTLLDSADTATLAEGSSATVAGHTVSISFVSSSEVVLVIDGDTTDTLGEGETQKLSDGSYVGVKDILFNSKDTGVSSVEFSIGSGKLTLTSGSEVQINDEAVSGVTSIITNTTTMSTISVTWAADEDVFITETSSALLPGFEAVRLSYGGLSYPMEEEIKVEQGGSLYAMLNDFPLKDGEADIAFLYGNTAGSFAGLGKDSTSTLVTSNATSGTQNITFDKDTDAYFVGSYGDSDEGESYLMRATNFVLDGSDNETDIEYYKDGEWVSAESGVHVGDTVSLGQADFLIGTIDRTGHSVRVANGSSNTALNGTLYSAGGLRVKLPRVINNFTVDNTSGAWNSSVNSTAFSIQMTEEDQDDNIAGGDNIFVVVGWSSDSEVEATNYTTSNTDAAATEIGDTDVTRDFTYSPLATEILDNDPSSGDESITVVYHGSEVAADSYITAPDATVTGGSGALGDVIVTDSEVSTVKSKNLVVVGGSCINSAAATLVGGAYCGSAWTTATGVGSGQFLIKGYASSSISNKLALLVAGYEAADTTNAATYLRTQSDIKSLYKQSRS